MAWRDGPFRSNQSADSEAPAAADAAPASDVRPVHERPVPASVHAARRRAGAAFAALCLGIYLARHDLSPGPVWCLALALILAGAVLLARGHLARGWFVRIALVLAAAAGGAGWYALRIESVNSDALHRVSETATRSLGIGPNVLKGSLVCVEGMVLDTPQVSHDAAQGLERFLVRQPSARFTLRVRRLTNATALLPASGIVRVWVDAESLPAVRAGDAARVTGTFVLPRPPMNPGEPDRRLSAAQDGVEGSLLLPSAELVEHIKAPSWWNRRDSASSAFARARVSLRARAQRAVDAMLAGNTSNASRLVRGLLLGDLGHEADGLQATFTRLGLLHVLTISGFHLGVMALVTLTVFRLTGDRGWLEPIVVGILVLGYAMIVPPNSPVLRSVLMVVLLLLAEAFGRRYDRLTILLWIGCVVLLLRPLDVWSLGFQLTFGLTALLYVVVPEFESRLIGPRVFGPTPGTVGAKSRVARVLQSAIAINLSCWVAAAPVVLFRTGLASPIAVLAGVIVGPLVVVVLWLGYVGLLFGMLWPPIAGWVGAALVPIATLVTRTASWLDTIPFGSMRLPSVSIAWTIVATFVLIAWLRHGWWRKVRGWAAIALLSAWLSIQWAGLPSNVAARIDMLSVGDGSCLLVRSGNDAILWDAGSLTAGLGSREIPTALRELGAWRIPTIVVTHPDLDHYGLLPDLIGPLGVKNVVLGQRFLDRAAEQSTGPEAYLLAELRERNVRIDIVGEGARLPLGSRELLFLSPRPNAPFGRDNEHSLVAALVQPGADPTTTDPQGSIFQVDALLTGDVAAEAVTSLMERLPNLRTRIMELPHHGSADPRAMEWTTALQPSVILQSTGPRRAFDPRWDLIRSGRRWLCTATHGAAWAEIMPDGTVRSGALRDGP